MPGHRVIARGDRDACAALDARDRFGDAQAGAGDEDRIDAGRRRHAFRRRFDRGDADARCLAASKADAPDKHIRCALMALEADARAGFDRLR